MNTNQRSTLLTSALIAIGIGLVCGVIVGSISGIYNLPMGVTIPIIVILSNVIFFSVWKKRQNK